MGVQKLKYKGFSWTNVVCLFNLVFTDIVVTAKIEMNLSNLILYAFTLF